MTLAEELSKLSELRNSGALSDDEFQRAKARLLDPPASPPRPEIPAMQAVNRLRRSRADRWLGGVCGGLGLSTGVDTWIWRLLFALFAFAGGAGLILYILLWIFVPDE